MRKGFLGGRKEELPSFCTNYSTLLALIATGSLGGKKQQALRCGDLFAHLQLRLSRIPETPVRNDTDNEEFLIGIPSIACIFYHVWIVASSYCIENRSVSQGSTISVHRKANEMPSKAKPRHTRDQQVRKVKRMHESAPFFHHTQDNTALLEDNELHGEWVFVGVRSNDDAKHAERAPWPEISEPCYMYGVSYSLIEESSNLIVLPLSRPCQSCHLDLLLNTTALNCTPWSN